MYIDLTVALNEHTPVYPGDPATKVKKAGILEQHGYQDHYVSVGTHVGTHVDAPSHMISGGKDLNEYPIEKFTGRGVYVQVKTQFDVDEIQKLDIREGDIVLFHTGMSDHYNESAYFEKYPVVPEELATWLVSRKVSIVGVDMCSPDMPPFPVHKILLAADVLIIENLTNLSLLKGKSFDIFAFPVKLEVDAAPLRVVAKINN